MVTDWQPDKNKNVSLQKDSHDTNFSAGLQHYTNGQNQTALIDQNLSENEISTTAFRYDATPTTPRWSRLQAGFEFFLVLLGLVFLFLFLKRDTGGDGWIRYQDLLTLLSYHVPHSKYSLIGPLFALPLLLIGRRLGQGQEWICAYNLCLFSLSLLLFWLLLKNRVEHGLIRKFLLILLTASMFAAHTAFFYSEVFTALCVGLGSLTLVACLGKKRLFGWIAIIFGVINTPASLLGLGFLVLKRVIDTRRLRYFLLIAGGLLGIALESWIRRGTPFGSGYEDDHGLTTIMPYSGLPGFSYPFLFGLLSLLFSFGKGIFFFAPGLLLPIRKTLRRYQAQWRIDLFQVYLLLLCFLSGLILVYARWWAWHGGIFWGPRFLLIASLPASLALAVRLHYKKEASLLVNLVTLVLFVLSVWVGINGTVYQWMTAIHMPEICTSNNYNLEMLCYYTPDFSTLWLPFVFHYSLTSGQLIFLIYSVVVGIYLIAPLSYEIGKQSFELLKRIILVYVQSRTWHF